MIATQVCRVFAAGVPQHTQIAADEINAMIGQGWLVEHVLSHVSGMLIVVFRAARREATGVTALPAGERR